MIWFKRTLGLIVLLLLAVAIVSAIYGYRAFPKLDGELRVKGLAATVEVTRDAADVTHIRAKSPRDAWFSLGYVHAQERGWQLEFNRRVMHGELSEIFGAATLETDKLLLTLGIMQAAERQWKNLPSEGRDAVQAYSDGINAFYAGSGQALQPEFHILGVTPGGKLGNPWSVLDSLGWSLMMALDLGGNWGNEMARLSAARVLKTEQLWQLFPPYPGEKPASSTDFSKLYADLGIYRSDLRVATKTVAISQLNTRGTAFFNVKKVPGRVELAELMSQEINDWAGSLGVVDGKGSNNWVVSGTHSSSGKPLLANDPHLGLSSPAIWYFAGLHTPAGKASDGSRTAAIDVVGATLPGLPFVVLGRTKLAAWGFTNTAPDVQDLYIEQINPTNPLQYRVPSPDADRRWEPFTTRAEVIRVKGQPDENFTVRETRHGPVLSDAQKSHERLIDTTRHVIALRWSALDADNQTLLAGLRANYAQSADEVVAAFSTYHSPMQNVVIADAAGHVAYKAIGKTPLRKPDNDIMGIAPAPGWEPRYDWNGWVPYAQTPQADQGSIDTSGWLATANQRITPPGYPFFMGQDWTVPYRHDRINQLLAAKPLHDLDSMQQIQADQLSLSAVKLWPFLAQALRQGTPNALTGGARQAMQGFDGVMRADSAAPLIFAAWSEELTSGILSPQLGDALFKSLYGKRNFRASIEDIMVRNDIGWCGAAGCGSQSVAALDRALTRLQVDYGADVRQWRWGRAHFALSAHKPFGNVTALAPLFDVRVPVGGDTFTVNVGQYWPNDEKTPFATRHAASMRAVYDLANLENSRFIYQTGQSGLVFSHRYRDMSDGWAAVQYRLLQMEPAITTHQLVLLP